MRIGNKMPQFDCVSCFLRHLGKISSRMILSSADDDKSESDFCGIEYVQSVIESQ